MTGDPERLTQILLNLVSNAHKYTPQGREHHRRHAGRACQGVHCRAGHRDRAIVRGAAAALYQVLPGPASAGPGGRGRGLGLAIARALVELHGGTLTVVSAPDQGSTFNVTLPAAHDLTG